MFNQIPPVTKNILLINVIVFLACMAIPALEPVLSGFYFESNQFRPWQVITHMFMHGGIAHIFFNMYALYIFGQSLEHYWGPRRFLTYYMVCGVGAFFLHEFVNYMEVRSLMAAAPAEGVRDVFENGFDALLSQRNYVDQVLARLNLAINTPMVGASGAVFGVLLAFGMMFPNTRLMLLFPPVELRAKWFVVIYGLIELFLAVRNAPGDMIAHYAHIGGMLFGFLLLKYWRIVDRR